MRINPVTAKESMDPEWRHLADGVIEVFGRLQGPHSILLLSPEADGPAQVMGEFFRNRSLIKSPLRELAIITTAREKECAYVWALQIGFGRPKGLRDEAISVVRQGGEVAELTAEEGEIILFVRELFRDNRVQPEQFEAIRQRYGERGVVELTALVGYYGMMCCLVNVAEMPPPDGGEPLYVA